VGKNSGGKLRLAQKYSAGDVSCTENLLCKDGDRAGGLEKTRGEKKKIEREPRFPRLDERTKSKNRAPSGRVVLHIRSTREPPPSARLGNWTPPNSSPEERGIGPPGGPGNAQAAERGRELEVRVVRDKRTVRKGEAGLQAWRFSLEKYCT